MVNFQPFSGVVTMIDNFSIGQNNVVGCYKLISVDGGYGRLVNFVVAPTTYFVDHVMVSVGDRVTGFYDANAPVPLIFPPQFRAIVMAKDTPNQNVKVDHFNGNLESSDGTLRLNISPHTQILLENGQAFNGSVANRDLIVLYGATTRSIPAQTTPHKIIVMC
ncbi:hypothetical protein FQ087_15280 [Sporosarcina sp. ANT_H38]|uniref:hypothetical protein n=1 Tax=Sporosarcina sp. ANT_H38 TaxID=2597358 RepID=UPI0011F13933|nr:hypothetical protein [Sporosarcina sp. ANT_H38]KAA0955936.1 hypothetical protein FQ087_15280 [Sporosarcina sp. ANT_H38]